MVGKDYLNASEKLQFYWWGPLRIIIILSNYVFKVKYLWIVNLEAIHGSRFKFYNTLLLNITAILSNVLSVETSMVVQRLIGANSSNDAMKDKIR